MNPPKTKGIVTFYSQDNKNAVGFMKNNGVDEKVIASVCKIIDEVSFAGTD